MFDFPLGYINGRAHGVPLEMLIDSACSFSTIDTSVYTKMRPKPKLHEFRKEVSTVNQQRLQIHGYCEVQLKIEDIGPFPYELVVADIGQGEAVFGYNLMKRLGVTLDIEKDEVRIANRVYPYGPCVGRRVATLRCCKAVTIGPHERRRITAVIDGELPDGCLGMATPNSYLTPSGRDRGVLMNPGLVEVRGNRVTVEVMNLTNEPRRLSGKYKMGMVEEIDEVVPFDQEETDVPPTNERMAKMMSLVSEDQASTRSGGRPDSGEEKKGIGEEKGDNPFSSPEEEGSPGCAASQRPQSVSAEQLEEFEARLRRNEEDLPDHLQPLMDGLSSELTQDQRNLVQALLTEYQDVFTGPDGKLGCTGLVKHKIDTGDHPPIKLPPRRQPMATRVVTDEKVREMLEQGVIEPSSSSWASPVVLVKKKDGSMRFCVDYRHLNDVTKKDAYPLPRLDDSVEAMSGAKWFSTLDLHSGYWQVEMDDKDKEKTAFVTRMGLYQFKVMPFGLTNAPATFERLMEMVLTGLQWQQLQVYLDDVIVFGCIFIIALYNLMCVFERFRKAKLKIKAKKCSLFQTRVAFLGHIVSRDGVSCDPEKLAVIRDWPHPETVTEVRSFLGFATYYRKFIPHFSTVAAPLTALTKKYAVFEWSKACELAFRRLQHSLMTAPVLAYPRAEGQLILDTDASDVGIGGVLSQVQDGEEKVLAYGSKTLSPSERNYCTTYKELLAVVRFMQLFKPYLWGQPVIVRTDHASLVWLRNFKGAEGMLAR